LVCEDAWNPDAEYQMQKLHLTEEKRSPSPLRTKLTEILSLKAIRNHPYLSYKRQHLHIDKHSKTTWRSTPPTWGQIKCLVDMAKNAIKGWGQEETPAVLLLVKITIFSQQVNAAEPRTYYMGLLCLIHLCFMRLPGKVHLCQFLLMTLSW
jgi:hypothetical protein